MVHNHYKNSSRIQNISISSTYSLALSFVKAREAGHGQNIEASSADISQDYYSHRILALQLQILSKLLTSNCCFRASLKSSRLAVATQGPANTKPQHNSEQACHKAISNLHSLVVPSTWSPLQGSSRLGTALCNPGARTPQQKQSLQAKYTTTTTLTPS